MCLTTDQKRPFIALFRPTVWKVLIQENDGRIYTPVQIAKVKLCKKLVNEEEPELIKDYGSQKLKLKSMSSPYRIKKSPPRPRRRFS